nr:amino acid adenylation domain-containing protein [Vibrio sp. 070316B]
MLLRGYIRVCFETSRDRNCIANHYLFKLCEHLERYPDKIFARSRNGSIKNKNAIAYIEQQRITLKRAGVKPGDRIGILVDRDEFLPLPLLTCLLDGYVYVPLDKHYPQERTKYILEKSRCQYVITDEPEHPNLIDVERSHRIPHQSSRDLPLSAHLSAIEPPAEDALAYIIFTSGSTGKPKGVSVRHQGIAQLVNWTQCTYRAEEIDLVLASTSTCFDISVFELVCIPASGGSMYVVENALDLANPLEADLTLINSVPSVVTEVLKFTDLPESLITINFGGEPLPLSLAQNLHKNFRVLNLYGPSEDTVYSTFFEYGGEESMYIGEPIMGTRAYVVDTQGNLLPDGELGELVLAGQGLAAGYWEEPLKTEQVFVYLEQAKEKVYKTGDLVRREDSGLRFCGRRDQQVKMRGFRIELTEIENTIYQLHGVSQCCVMKIEEGYDKLVCLYVGDESITPNAVRDLCQRELPNYMVPTHIQKVVALPQTPAGKTDRQRCVVDYKNRSNSSDRHFNSLEDIQTLLTAVMSNSTTQTFSDMGINSMQLLSIKMILKRELGMDETLEELNATSPVQSLSSWLTLPNKIIEEVLPPPQDIYPLSETQQRFVFAQEKMQINDRVSYGFTFKDTSVSDVYALAEHIVRNEIFQTGFYLKEQVWLAKTTLPAKVLHLGNSASFEELLAQVNQQMLFNGNALCFVGFGHVNGSPAILINAFHGLLDGFTKSLIVEDICEYLTHQRVTLRPALSQVIPSTYYFTLEMARQIQARYPRPNRLVSESIAEHVGEMIALDLADEYFVTICDYLQATNISEHTLFSVSLLRALARHYSINGTVVSPVVNREYYQERSYGCFINVLAINYANFDLPLLSDALGSNRHSLNDALEFKKASYLDVLECCSGYASHIVVVGGVQENFNARLSELGVVDHDIDGYLPCAKNPITFFYEKIPGSYRVRIIYNRSVVAAELISEVISDMKRELISL